jgi:hypothetical protein
MSRQISGSESASAGSGELLPVLAHAPDPALQDAAGNAGFESRCAPDDDGRKFS